MYICIYMKNYQKMLRNEKKTFIESFTPTLNVLPFRTSSGR